MRVGEVGAMPGRHAFGFLRVAASRSGLAPDIAIHVFAGAEPGPTVLVQAAIHGNEVIATAAVLRFVRRLDPRTLRGNVIAVPVVNRVGFDQSQRLNTIDGKDISACFPGNLHGSSSDQIAHVYFEEVIRQAQVMVEFHAGGQTGYERYILFAAERDRAAPTAIERTRRTLAVAFGLDAAAFFPHGIFGTGTSEQAFENAGVVMIQPEIGGGTGWFANDADNLRVAERGIWNVLKAMRMVEGEMDSDGPRCTIYNANEVLWKPPVDGLFIRRKRFGERLRAGDVYAEIRDPYTGRIVATMSPTKDSIVIPSGQEWPTVGTTSVGILGTVDEVVDRRSTDLRVR